MCGRRDIILETSQKAMDLDYDGLMIESHISPDDAWSDAAQQITPEELADLLSCLIYRNSNAADNPIHDEIVALRM